MKSLRQILAHGLAGLAILFAAGCATPATSPPLTRVPALDQSAPPPSSSPGTSRYAETWVGEYEGTGEVFSRNRGSRERGARIKLNIQSMGKNRLHIEWGPADGGALYVDATSFSTLAGRTDPETSPYQGYYSYSFSKSGDIITGAVKSYRRQGNEGPLQPGNEWSFTVRKVAKP